MRIRTFLLAAASAVCISSPARACVFDPDHVPADVENADVVFTGTVTETRHIPPALSPNRVEFKTTFAPDRIFKGEVTPGKNLMVIQMHDEWSRYTYFTPGQKYLVVAVNGQYDLKIGACSAVMALDPAAAGAYEPPPEYKYTLAAQLGDATMFPMPKAAGDGARKRMEQEKADGQGDQDNPDGKQDSGGGN